MNRFPYWSSPIDAHLIGAAEWQREAREATHQAWLIRESGIALGRGSDRGFAAVRRSLGLALIRIGERLRGTPAATAQASALPVTG
jgi:hypothetical protein